MLVLYYPRHPPITGSLNRGDLCMEHEPLVCPAYTAGLVGECPPQNFLDSGRENQMKWPRAMMNHDTWSYH